MQIYRLVFYYTLMMAVVSGVAVQEAAMPVPSALKDAVLHDATCGEPGGNTAPSDSTNLGSLEIRVGARDLGTIVTVHGACHCQGPNCDTLVYLHAGDGYRLALREKYASLHPMKIVKRGMPSLTGQFEISAAKMETTVYDWDGKGYRPSLCATVIKNKRVASIERHPCRAETRIDDRAR